MPAPWSYLRNHPWQRRLLTASLALVLGAGGALLALPHVRDYLLLRDLGQDDSLRRARAIAWGVRLAAGSERTVRRLVRALGEADDEKFLAILAVLKRAGRFDAVAADPNRIDRMWALEAGRNPFPETRRLAVTQLALGGRDNRFVRSGLAAAGKDPSPAVRATAAVLAAALGDDAALAALLADEEPEVVARAAVAAALAGRPDVASAVARRAAAPGDPNATTAAMYALARLDPNAGAAALSGALAAATGDGRVRERLIYAAAQLPPNLAGPIVLGALDADRRAGRLPSAATLSAVGALRLAAGGPAVREVLAAAVRPRSGVRIGQVHAALLAADALRLPVRAEVDAICRKLWRPEGAYRLLLAAAADVLGRQVSLVQGDPNAPSREQCIRTLRMAAVQDYPATAPAAAGGRRLVNTPLPSTAAAVALWRLDSPLAEEFIAMWAGSELSLPGDVIAWRLGRSGSRRAFELGLRFVPPPDAPPGRKEYNDDRRAAGAMLLALAARTAEQKALARGRIRARLEGGRLGGESSFHVRGAFRCALAALGDVPSRRRVVELLETGQFSQRRAVTALTVAGSPEGFDWVLCNEQVPDDDALLLLVDEGLGEVLAACLPGLPGVDPAAGADLQAFQLGLLRDAWVIRHGSLQPIWPPVPAGAAP